MSSELKQIIIGVIIFSSILYFVNLTTNDYSYPYDAEQDFVKSK